MMEILIQIFIVFICFSGLMYFLMASIFFYGWIKIPEFKINKEEEILTSVSIVVAARNEENNIIACLNDLAKQDYPLALFEIIIVDDNSEDDTCEMCNDFIQKTGIHNLRLIKLADINKISKKEAIKCGVENATGQLIITTDADCSVGNKWVRSMVSFYEKKNFKLICGPVTYDKSKGLFQQFQLLDFLSMIISGAGAIGANSAFMGNAANMAFEKKVYLDVNSKIYDAAFASGDDVFLMHKVKGEYKKSIGFIKCKETTVIAKAKNTLKELVLQRVRWASKSKGYKDIHSLFFTLTVLVFNFSMVFALFAGILNTYYIHIYLLLLALKVIVDFPLIYSIISFNKRKDLLLHYWWIQLVYPFYIVVSATLSALKKHYVWKGRILK